MIPIKKGIETTGQPAVSIESGNSSIPRKPILVEGGPAPEPITVTALNVTENGRYDAGENAAYNPVVVNVPPDMPNEYLESEWNLLISNPTYGYNDTVKKVALPTNRYRNFANGFLTGANGFINLNLANCGDIKRFIVKMGEFDRSQEPTSQYMGLFSFAYGTNGQTIIFDNTNNKWKVRDAGGTIEYIETDILPKYAFENATVEVVYGAKYINGELYRGKIENGVTTTYQKNTTVYVHAANNETYVIEFTFPLSGDRPDYMFTCRIGVGSNGWLGAKYENAKIYNVLNCYDKYYNNDTQRTIKYVPKFKSEESEVK